MVCLLNHDVITRCGGGGGDVAPCLLNPGLTWGGEGVNLGIRWGWVVCLKSRPPHPLFGGKSPQLPIEWEARWALGPLLNAEQTKSFSAAVMIRTVLSRSTAVFSEVTTLTEM